jgi:hypothetical protein
MLSRDPLGGGLAAPASQNRYAYAQDNPTTLMDPSGLSTIQGTSSASTSTSGSTCGGCAMAVGNATGTTGAAIASQPSSASLLPSGTITDIIGILSFLGAIAGAIVAAAGVLAAVAAGTVLLLPILLFVAALIAILAVLTLFDANFWRSTAGGLFLVLAVLLAILLVIAFVMLLVMLMLSVIAAPIVWIIGAFALTAVLFAFFSYAYRQNALSGQTG